MRLRSALRSSRWGYHRGLSSGFSPKGNGRKVIALLQTSRIQLPASLPSKRFCYPPLSPFSTHKRDRYYEGSDSRRSHAARRVSPLIRLAFPPFRSQPRDPSKGRFVSRLSAFGYSRLHRNPASSPRVHAESDSFSYRLAVRLRLLPTPPPGDAVAFGYTVTTLHDGDSHPADNAESQTHWMAVTSTAMTALGRFGRRQRPSLGC